MAQTLTYYWEQKIDKALLASMDPNLRQRCYLLTTFVTNIIFVSNKRESVTYSKNKMTIKARN